MRQITPRNDSDITSAIKTVIEKNEASIVIGNTERSGQVWNNTYDDALWALPDAEIGFIFEANNLATSLNIVASNSDMIIVSGLGTTGQLSLDTAITHIRFIKIQTNLWQATYEGTVTIE